MDRAYCNLEFIPRAQNHVAIKLAAELAVEYLINTVLLGT